MPQPRWRSSSTATAHAGENASEPVPRSRSHTRSDTGGSPAQGIRSAVDFAPGPGPTEGLCAGSSDWDVDSEVSGPIEWLAAAEACVTCPALLLCERALTAAYPDWGERGGDASTGAARARPLSNPVGMVWAGRIFDEKGTLLRPYAVRRRVLAARAERRRAAVDRGGAGVLSEAS